MNLSKHKLAARVAYAESLRQGAPQKQKVVLREPDARAAAALGWEADTPRCECCAYCQKEKTIIHQHTSTLPVLIVPPVCRRGKFYTRPGGICDFWTGRDGSTLS